MRKIILVSIIAFIACSCIKNADDVYQKQVNVDYETIKPFESVKVNVQNGETAYVILASGDTAAVTNIDGTIVNIPAIQNSRAAQGYTISKEVNSGEEYLFSNCVYFTLMFEDSKNGDYDYNDVILHMALKRDNFGFAFYAQPVAYGATKTLKFGVDLYGTSNGNEVSKSFTFSNDLRHDTNFFGSKDQGNSFINTGSDKTEYYRYKINKISPLNGEMVSAWLKTNNLLASTNAVGMIWWIEDESGIRYYSVPSSKIDDKSWTDAKGYPYGIVITGTNNYLFVSDKGEKCGADWLNFPLEGVSIEKAFPGFNNWLEGKGSVDWMNSVEGATVDAIGPSGNNGSTKASNPYSLFLYEGSTWNSGYVIGNYGSGYIYRK